MAGKSRKSEPKGSQNSIKPAETTLSALRQNADLWYRIRVLLHDLGSVGSDQAAAKRLSSTTHELYISAPYFTESEAIKIRTAVIDSATECTTEEEQSTNGFTGSSSSSSCAYAIVEDAIHSRLASFFDKRRASGDSRPCGPHDMVPIYASVFGIDNGELKDERFLSRLRRSGLGDSVSQGESATSGQNKGGGKGQKK